jgi:hypothetical protein
MGGPDDEVGDSITLHRQYSLPHQPNRGSPSDSYPPTVPSITAAVRQIAKKAAEGLKHQVPHIASVSPLVPTVPAASSSIDQIADALVVRRSSRARSKTPLVLISSEPEPTRKPRAGSAAPNTVQGGSAGVDVNASRSGTGRVTRSSSKNRSRAASAEPQGRPGQGRGKGKSTVKMATAEEDMEDAENPTSGTQNPVALGASGPLNGGAKGQSPVPKFISGVLKLDDHAREYIWRSAYILGER